MGTQGQTQHDRDILFDVRKPKRYKVLMHNDDYTTMDFVVEVLMSIFHKSEIQAVAIMTAIHHEGVGLCGIYTQEIAETKILQTKELSKSHKFPLKCTMEEE